MNGEWSINGELTMMMAVIISVDAFLRSNPTSSALIITIHEALTTGRLPGAMENYLGMASEIYCTA